MSEQPLGWGARATFRDPSLPHQIVLDHRAVGCNCGWKQATLEVCHVDVWAVYNSHLAPEVLPP